MADLHDDSSPPRKPTKQEKARVVGGRQIMAQGRDYLSLKLPDDLPGTLSSSLFLNDLLIVTCELKEWQANTTDRPNFDPSSAFCRQRLVAACRLQLQNDGGAFFDRPHELRFVVHWSEGKEAFSDIITPNGQSILECLDLLVDQDSGQLLDGASFRQRRRPDETTIVAFYLPQFYPFPENDLWWGDGFTEWSNVVDAAPQLDSHKMPLWPADLGFYDLRIDDTRRRQSQLASQYGVDGFCYYFYWFSGRRLMREVLDRILSSGEPATDFCLCWANESWSRRWDGSDGQADLLIGQMHDPDVDKTIIADLLPFFADERYIKVDGSPVFLIYRLDIMTNASEVIESWRASAHRAGFPGLFVVAVRSFGLTDEAAEAVDAIVDFPPHTAVSTEIQDSLSKNSDFSGKVYDYRQVVVEATTRKPGQMLTFPGVMPRWDNTARKGNKSHIFWNSTPNAFKLWTTFALQQAQLLPLGKRFLFINSWNEWGEGAMLEPDRLYGRSYLEALRSARGGYVLGPSDISKFALISNLPKSEAQQMLEGFSAEVQMVAQVMSWQRTKTSDAFRPGAPELVSLSASPPDERGGMMIFDHSSSQLQNGKILLRYGQPISLIGWAMMDRTSPHVWGRVAYVILTSVTDNQLTFHVPISSWTSRVDVSKHYEMGLEPSDCYFGFDISVSTDNILPGTYRPSMVQALNSELLFAPCYTEVEKLEK